ncbi:hypothetical protein [Lacinutrix jangbogonensis]|uniref:hypothetical protein n=1 Tax=Lacinutrix jangbogonensis TaxID=1469557 RepID=UPI00053E1771|nr:hypothetical protein [Lacinutrix jangbogonensis]
MKRLNAFFILFTALLFVSCSSNDDSTPEPVAVPLLTGNYFPSNLNDLWIYNVESTNSEDATLDFTETDLLTVNSTTGNNFTLEANNGTTPSNGTMSTFLVNGNLTRTDDSLLYNGSIEVPEELSDFFDTAIVINNAELYNLNAAVNEELFTNSGSETETLDLNGTMIPLTINYTLSTTKLNSSNTLTVDGEVFNDVIKSNMSLNMEVTATFSVLGQQITRSVLDAQDVMSIDYYFSKNVGLIKADATQGYTINASFILFLEGLSIDIGLPTSVTITNNQEIDGYLLN